MSALSPASKKPLSDCTVAIAGLGLMGGSLGLALQGQVARVIGIARRRETLQQALAIGAIHAGCETLAAGAAEADVVVLATPVGVVLEQVAELGRLAAAGALRPGLVLLDLGSTKAQVCQAMAGLPPGVEPVGGHPMCGKETSGLDVAEARLYEGAPFVLTPLPRTAPWALDLARSLVVAVGARPIEMGAERHDRLVAAISHLPYVLSLALFAAVEDVAAEDEMVWQLAAGGFRSTTRLAGSDVTMMLDILLTNRDNVLKLIEGLRCRLDGLAQALDADNRAALRFQAERIRGLRADFLERYGNGAR
ncbi:MAG: prephenate dehydrogenase [Anaerolineae bacterium]|nr:prephenate dehydrogenase [Anaerolineae bacterium]